MTLLESHNLAALIPPMSADEFSSLKADIAQRGLVDPIVLYEGKVLDGRHRYRACVETSTEPQFRDFDGSDPVSYVISLNVHRRHLSASQKGVVALNVESEFAKQAAENLEKAGQIAGQGLSYGGDPINPVHAADKAAAVVGVSQGYVSGAKKIQKEAPDLIDDISAGTITIPEAKKIMKRREKAIRVAEISKTTPAPIQSTGPFPVIYADPPWRYESGTADPSDAIENHYPTMVLDDIKALQVPAADNAVLFLWATSPKLSEAIEVMEAWGFSYRTCAVWVKDKIGLGYYFRQAHELLLVGMKGHVNVPDAEDRVSSVINAPRGAHSVKPHIVYEMLEKMYPFSEKCELFARNTRDGWASWGNQAAEVAA